ncbi:unnamed protein product [Symbiodinium sp. CCMP2456]|nr:unnamed protein product [Symbiodinium sp. CCMP2456]
MSEMSAVHRAFWSAPTWQLKTARAVNWEIQAKEEMTADSAGLRVRTGAARGTNLEDDSDDVGSGVGDIHSTLDDVVVLVPVDLQGLVDRRRGSRWDELLPGRGDRLRACEDLEGILAEVAVRPGGAHRGDLAEVGHESCEVTSAGHNVVDSLAAGVCRKGQVRSDPADGHDEACDAGGTSNRRVVRALKAITSWAC